MHMVLVYVEYLYWEYGLVDKVLGEANDLSLPSRTHLDSYHHLPSFVSLLHLIPAGMLLLQEYLVGQYLRLSYSHSTFFSSVASY